MRVSRARTPTERALLSPDGPLLKNPRRSVYACARLRVCESVNAFDVSYVAFDRMQLNCRYKSTKSWVSRVPRAFQRLSPSYARNQRVIHFAREP